MERIMSFENVNELEYNKVIVDAHNSTLNNSNIMFYGKNNILFVEDGVNFDNSKIIFNANNSLVYLSKSKYAYKLNLTVNNYCTAFIGCNCYFNGILNIILSEYQNYIMGNDCLFSFGIWIRTADPHLIYDAETRKRVNDSKGIFIGDHVWVGQSSMILKGTEIGSGSVVGGMSLVSGKKINSNCCYAGNPAKLVKEKIFYSSECVHKWTKKDTEKYKYYKNTDDYIYSKDETTVEFSQIDEKLKSIENADKRLDYIINNLVNQNSKNRFFINVQKQSFLSRFNKIKLSKQ